MNIVKQKIEFFHPLVDIAPKQAKKLFRFGIQVFAFREVTSLRRAGRLSPEKWNTSKSKSYRLTRNKKMRFVFLAILKKLSLVKGGDVLAVDFSDFGNGFQVLMFAKQTKKGRALPVYFEILRYPIQKGSQNLFVNNAVDNISRILGFKPKLVFDRGFACPFIIKFLAQNRYIFYIRIKKGKKVKLKTNGKLCASKNISKNDLLVLAYEKDLRLVISDEQEDMKEPWYIVTNDTVSTRNEIVGIYYHRFEIEEFFRDEKRLLGLEHVNWQKKSSLAVVLWFVVLGCWFAAELEEKMSKEEQKERDVFRLSSIRYFFEKAYKEMVLAFEAEFMRALMGENCV